MRSSPNSRVRCATVIEKVLKMMNAPTTSDDVGEHEQERAQEAEVAFEVAEVCLPACSAPVRTSTVRGSTARMRSRSCAGVTPGCGGDVDLVEAAPARPPPAAPPSACRIAAPAPPKDSPPPNFTMPTIV